MAGSEVTEDGPMVDIRGSSVTEPARKEAMEIPKGKQLSHKEKRARAPAEAMSGCQASPPQGGRMARGRLEAGKDHQVLSRGVLWRKSARGTAEDCNGEIVAVFMYSPGCPHKHDPADCKTF
jgi:hypothetical protein